MASRRNFLKKTMFAAGMAMTEKSVFSFSSKAFSAAVKSRKQIANMCGYAAPPLPVVHVGFIGLGNRGKAAVERMIHIEGIEITALCDLVPEKIKKSQYLLKKAGLPPAKEYTGSEEAWKEMCENPTIDLIYICTPWKWHAPMSIYAMENGKHAATEVPAALTLDECWHLVETSEKTRKHCIILENCCYDFFELLTLNMARNGLFGEIIHAEGAYIHNLMDHNFSKTYYDGMWRLKENQKNGNLYPTHGLGPVCQVMNINRGDKLEYLVSMSSDDFQMAPYVNALALQDNFYAPYAGKTYRGNMNISLIRSYKGKTLMIQHDVSSPRPYSRIHLISGTKGIAQKWPEPPRIAFGHTWLNEEEMKDLQEKYTPYLLKHIGEMAKKVGGHGGMDFIMDWRLIDCLRNGLPVDMDVYDAATWSAITPLSQESLARKSGPVKIPDFTRGAWKTNQPVTLSLEGGGNTGIRFLQLEETTQLNVH